VDGSHDGEENIHSPFEVQPIASVLASGLASPLRVALPIWQLKSAWTTSKTGNPRSDSDRRKPSFDHLTGEMGNGARGKARVNIPDASRRSAHSRGLSAGHGTIRRSSASNRMLDFGQARLFELQPVRRIIYGLALCFLAALLALEAKAAWVANAGGSPSDLSAVKLCPSIPRIDSEFACTSVPSQAPIDPIQPIDLLERPANARWRSFSTEGNEGSIRITGLAFFSGSLFFRPPPAL
jgi:hypothetical protein